MEFIKVVAVGDPMVGKTCVFRGYTKMEYQFNYKPTVFDEYTADLTVDDKRIKLGLYDTAGSPDYDRLRPMSYKDSEILLVCFAINQPRSLESVTLKWLPEIDLHCPNAVKILVGCKMGKRSTDPTNCISKSYIESRARKLKMAYFETSGLSCEGLDECFEKVVRQRWRQC